LKEDVPVGATMGPGADAALVTSTFTQACRTAEAIVASNFDKLLWEGDAKADRLGAELNRNRCVGSVVQESSGAADATVLTATFTQTSAAADAIAASKGEESAASGKLQRICVYFRRYALLNSSLTTFHSFRHRICPPESV
jgi:hypothetical protein